MSFTVLVSATSARAPSSNIPHQFRKHSQLITSEALNLPPAPSPSAGTRSPFKGCFQLQGMNWKCIFMRRKQIRGVLLSIWHFLWERAVTAVSSFWIIWSGITWSFLGGILCVLGEAKRFVGVCTHPNYWRERVKPGTRNVFAAFSERHIHHCCRLQLCFICGSPCYLHYSSRFQENLWSWGSPWSSCVWNKMKGIMFILILPNRHCSLVEYTVNVVHG